MRVWNSLGAALCVPYWVFAAACGAPPAPAVHADTVLFNGKIITVDPNDSVVQALAIRDGKILALGRSAEILTLAGPATERIDLGGVKMYIDGSGGARTAWLYEDWNRNRTETDTGNRGYPVIDPQILREQIRLFHNAGLHVSVHSIGDRAIDWVVDSYAMVLEENPLAGLRHGIIHANIPSDRALDLMAGLQKKHQSGYPEPSATFMWWIGDTYAGNFGPDRSLRLNPFKSYLEKGIRWAGGSDFNVTPFPARPRETLAPALSAT